MLPTDGLHGYSGERLPLLAVIKSGHPFKLATTTDPSPVEFAIMVPEVNKEHHVTITPERDEYAPDLYWFTVTAQGTTLYFRPYGVEMYQPSTLLIADDSDKVAQLLPSLCI